jgi:RNA polymerase sigma factor (sigma-70 family)
VARLPGVNLPPFEQVVSEHGATVLRVCRALLPAQDAEDAAAETFLAALAAYPRLRADSDVRAWLVTIAHRKSIDAARAARRGPLPVADVPERPAGAEFPLPDEELWDAVRGLPDKQRQAVAYHYVADLPYREVGTLIGSGEAAARRSAADGIRALRRVLPAAAEGSPDTGNKHAAEARS